MGFEENVISIYPNHENEGQGHKRNIQELLHGWNVSDRVSSKFPAYLYIFCTTDESLPRGAVTKARAYASLTSTVKYAFTVFENNETDFLFRNSLKKMKLDFFSFPQRIIQFIFSPFVTSLSFQFQRNVL